jgi:hypothetical protein
MGNNEQISGTSYYLLPSGLYLEDFIYAKGLNFNCGSALKYLWRAGYKDGETLEKDLSKAEHYIKFEAKCRGVDESIVDDEIKSLLEEAYMWRQHEELEDGVAK